MLRSASLANSADFDMIRLVHHLASCLSGKLEWKVMKGGLSVVFPIGLSVDPLSIRPLPSNMIDARRPRKQLDHTASGSFARGLQHLR
jgi:hypothetical protein